MILLPKVIYEENKKGVIKMEKIKKLAHMLVTYSLDVKENERVLIDCHTFNATDLVEALILEIKNRKGCVMVSFSDAKIDALLGPNYSDSQIDLMASESKYKIENFDSFIHIRYNENDYESHLLSQESRRRLAIKTEVYRNIRVNERKWVLLNYPSSLDAYRSCKNTNEYKDFALDAMCYSYDKMNEKIIPLKKLMENTDKVRITGEGTDLTFSILGMPIIPCVGEKNIPDGEIYCAPIKDSVNGVIRYNTPCPYQGCVFHGVTLTFENGKIIDATCDEAHLVKRLNEIFDTDEGSRYVGEFSIGLNPMIKDPQGDILYDEKIIGSIHFTPGAAYQDSYNGNDSSIHWDMVLIQREEYGGGNIYFDGVNIRKDGVFTLDELMPLNFDN